MKICNSEKLLNPGFCQMIPRWLVSMEMANGNKFRSWVNKIRRASEENKMVKTH